MLKRDEVEDSRGEVEGAVCQPVGRRCSLPCLPWSNGVDSVCFLRTSPLLCVSLLAAQTQHSPSSFYLSQRSSISTTSTQCENMRDVTQALRGLEGLIFIKPESDRGIRGILFVKTHAVSNVQNLITRLYRSDLSRVDNARHFICGAHGSCKAR